jgi:hypothetical protein
MMRAMEETTMPHDPRDDRSTDADRWARLAAEALALFPEPGTRVLAHLERRDGRTLVRHPDGTLAGVVEAAPSGPCGPGDACSVLALIGRPQAAPPLARAA